MLLIRFIDLLHFPMVVTRIDKRACHFDVTSSPFQCHISALMKSRSALMKTLGKKTNKTERARITY